MERIELQKTEFLTVDLTKINGEGEFKCPKCGIEISPDDLTEETFTVLDIVLKENSIERIILKCNRCGSQIHLIGFYLLNKMKAQINCA